MAEPGPGHGKPLDFPAQRLQGNLHHRGLALPLLHAVEPVPHRQHIGGIHKAGPAVDLFQARAVQFQKRRALSRLAGRVSAGEELILFHGCYLPFRPGYRESRPAVRKHTGAGSRLLSQFILFWSVYHTRTKNAMLSFRWECLKRRVIERYGVASAATDRRLRQGRGPTRVSPAGSVGSQLVCHWQTLTPTPAPA